MIYYILSCVGLDIQDLYHLPSIGEDPANWDKDDIFCLHSFSDLNPCILVILVTIGLVTLSEFVVFVVLTKCIDPDEASWCFPVVTAVNLASPYGATFTLPFQLHFVAQAFLVTISAGISAEADSSHRLQLGVKFRCARDPQMLHPVYLYVVPQGLHILTCLSTQRAGENIWRSCCSVANDVYHLVSVVSGVKKSGVCTFCGPIVRSFQSSFASFC